MKRLLTLVLLGFGVYVSPPPDEPTTETLPTLPPIPPRSWQCPDGHTPNYDDPTQAPCLLVGIGTPGRIGLPE